MKNTHAIQRVLDLVIGRRIFTICWLSASLGISIMQMRLLAQAWLVLPHALAPACLMSAWILGSLVGSCLSGATRVWGSSSLAFTLLWLISPSLVSWHLSLGLVSPALMSMAALTSMAVFLGASSTAWLAQQRSWPAVGERLALARSLVGLTVGLVVAWMLPTAAQAAITEKTAAIVPVHVHGQMADMLPLLDLADTYGLSVVEDAAQAHGATYACSSSSTRKASYAGSMGDLGCFSLNGIKNMGELGDGGMVTVSARLLARDRAVADRLRGLRDLGRLSSARYIHDEWGMRAWMNSPRWNACWNSLSWIPGTRAVGPSRPAIAQRWTRSSTLPLPLRDARTCSSTMPRDHHQ